MADDPHVFNTGDYTQRVLRPFLSTPSRAPLHVRYDLDPRWATGDVPGSVVLNRVGQVVAYWKRAVQNNNTAGISAVCRNWLKHDADLRAKFGPEYEDPQWWLGHLPEADTPAPEPDGPPPATGTPATSSAETDQQAATTALNPQVLASATRTGVHLTWSVPGIGSQRARFTVERGDAAGGTRLVLATDLEADGFLDTQAPTARLLWYYVTARTPDSEGASEPRSAWFAPPVHDVTLDVVGVCTVEGSWAAHPSATGFRIRRTLGRGSADPEDGVPLSPPDGWAGFRDALTPEGKVHYRIAPVYRNADTGRDAEGDPVHVSIMVSPPPPAPRIESFSISEDRGQLELSVRIAGVTGPDRFLLLQAREPGTPVPGTAVPTRQITGHGVELTPREDAGKLRFLLPTGRAVVAPVAIRGALACFGAGVETAAAPAVYDVHLERFDEGRLQLSWHWPKDVRLAEVTWITGGVTTRTEVTDVELQRTGYVEHVSLAETTVEIVALARAQGHPDLRATSVRQTVEAAGTELRYKVIHKRPTLFQPRRLLIRFTATRLCEDLVIEIRIRRAGTSPEQDTVLTTARDVRCGPDTPWEITLPVPARTDSMLGKRLVSCLAWHEGREMSVDNFQASDRGVD